MKTLFNLRSLLGCGLALALFAGSAQAAPLTLAVDAGSSDITLDIDIGGLLNPTGTAVVSGSLDADIDGAGGFEALGAAMAFSDLHMEDSFFGQTVTVDTANVIATLIGGPVVGTLGGPNTYDFDLNGFLLSLNQGTMTQTALGTTTVTDLSVTPLDLPFTSSSTASYTTSDLGGGLLGIDLVVTVSESVTTVIEGFDVTITATGQILANGVLDTNVVPEPASLILTGLALAGLSALRRRHA